MEDKLFSNRMAKTAREASDDPTNILAYSEKCNGDINGRAIMDQGESSNIGIIYGLQDFARSKSSILKTDAPSTTSPTAQSTNTPSTNTPSTPTATNGTITSAAPTSTKENVTAAAPTLVQVKDPNNSVALVSANALSLVFAAALFL